MALSFVPPPPAPVRPAPRAHPEVLSLETLHRDHFAYVWRTLRHLGVPPAWLDDACQEVFVVVHRRLAEFEGRSDPKTWLYAIARRVAADQRRSQRRAARRVAALQADEPATSDGIEDPVARNEAAAHVFRFLDGLDDDKRAVFTLYAFEGLRGPEIAERLAMNLNTVYARLRVARAGFAQSCRSIEEHEAACAVAACSEPATQRQAQAWVALAPMLGASAAASPIAFAGAFKLIGGLLLGTTVAVGAWQSSREPTPALAPRLAIATSVDTVDDAAPAPAGTHAPWPAAPALVDEPTADIRGPDPVESPPSTPAPARRASPSRRLPSRDAAPSTATPTTTPAIESQPAAPAPPAPPAADPLHQEVDLIAKIREAARTSDHAQVIALAGLHARGFAHGRLVAERRAYEAAARCSLGQLRRGRSLAQRYLDDHPLAVLATSVRNACFGG